MATPVGMLDVYEKTGNARVVAIGETGFISFQQSPIIGTGNMNGGSVAIIVSQQSAILAHIPPLPWLTANSHLGDANTERMMAIVRMYYDHYRAFYATATAHVVCPLHNGTVGLENQMGIIINCFREMGLATTEVHHYTVPVDRTAPGYGTVVVVSDGVYVQDVLVAGLQALPTMPSSAEEPTMAQEDYADDAKFELGSGTGSDYLSNGDYEGAGTW